MKCYYRISSARRGGGHVKRRDGRGEDCELFVYLADLGGAKMPASDAVGNDLIINQTERCIARACVARSLPPRAEGAHSLGWPRARRAQEGVVVLTGDSFLRPPYNSAAVSSADALCTPLPNRFFPGHVSHRNEDSRRFLEFIHLNLDSRFELWNKRRKKTFSKKF